MERRKSARHIMQSCVGLNLTPCPHIIHQVVEWVVWDRAPSAPARLGPALLGPVLRPLLMDIQACYISPICHLDGGFSFFSIFYYQISHDIMFPFWLISFSPLILFRRIRCKWDEKRMCLSAWIRSLAHGVFFSHLTLCNACLLALTSR